MEQNKKLKPFDLEKAKAGARVVTRDGRNVRIICWDRVHTDYPVVALVERKDETKEDTETYTLDGACVEGEKNSIDLFMAPAIVEKWVNVYKMYDGYYYGRFYDSEQEAFVNKDDNEYITTTKVSWEE